MNHIYRTLTTVALALVFVISGCSSDAGISKKLDEEKLTASRGEHDRDENGGGEGEESGTELSLDQNYNQVRNGAHLSLAFDTETNSFIGTVENTTSSPLKNVRVEVHLSNGLELGPTTPADLAPGEKRKVNLSATNKYFDGWTAHPEVGNAEHGSEGGSGEHGREGSGEHGGEEGGEHGGEGRGEHGGERSGEHGGSVSG